MIGAPESYLCLRRLVADRLLVQGIADRCRSGSRRPLGAIADALRPAQQTRPAGVVDQNNALDFAQQERHQHRAEPMQAPRISCLNAPPNCRTPGVVVLTCAIIIPEECAPLLRSLIFSSIRSRLPRRPNSVLPCFLMPRRIVPWPGSCVGLTPSGLNHCLAACALKRRETI
jgi:hypothetical protein